MGHSESRDAIVCRELVTELLYRNAFSSQDTLTHIEHNKRTHKDTHPDGGDVPSLAIEHSSSAQPPQPSGDRE